MDVADSLIKVENDHLICLYYTLKLFTLVLIVLTSLFIGIKALGVDFVAAVDI